MGKDIRALPTLRCLIQDQIGWRPTPKGMKTVSDSADPERSGPPWVGCYAYGRQNTEERNDQQ
jgi:hypothetical protein